MKTLIISFLMIGFGAIAPNEVVSQQKVGGDEISINQEEFSADILPEKRCYYRPNDGTYRITRDGDGFVVRKPDGSEDSWGNGYSWSDVLEGYRLTNNMKTNC